MTTTSAAAELDGTQSRIHVHHWAAPDPRYVVLIAHGYGEHAGRYEHVAQAFVAHGGTVYAPDHVGHGLSGGDRALVTDIEDVVTDLHGVAEIAAAANPGLPTVLLGHSMGGIIASRYAQRYGAELKALILSGPAIGGNPGFEQLLAMDPIPEIPIDPAILSNDPAVGEAYAADELVYHGPFLRPTLEAMFGAVDTIAQGGSLGDLPTLWIHGTNDQLAPIDVSEAALDRIAGSDVEKHRYEGAQHEVLNEVNKDEILATVTTFVDRALG